MSKFSVAMKRFGGFLKRNAFYFLIVLCIASVATVIALAVTRNNVTQDPSLSVGDNQTVQPEPPNDDTDQKPGIGDDQNQDPPKPQLTFKMPCNGSVLGDNQFNEILESSTLGHWATHMGVDFVSDDLNVYAAADGTVSELKFDDLNGNYIVISHDDGYKTIYKSLDGLGSFKVGDKVSQGQLLGKMSDSQGEEMHCGAHLHFEMMQDGKYIDPFVKIVINEK